MQMDTPLAPSPLRSHLYINERFEAFREVYEHLRLECPYRRDRIDRGLGVDEALPPSWHDLHAHVSSSQVYGIQNKKQITAATKSNLVPVGLPPDLHYELGRIIDNPLEQESMLADDICFALRTLFTHGHKIEHWRALQWTIFRRSEGRFSELREFMVQHACSTFHLVSSHIQFDRFDSLRYSIQWPDT